MTDVLSRTYVRIVVPRSTGAYGDVLAAVGLAALVAGLRGDVHVEIDGDERSFVVLPGAPLTDEELERLPREPGYQYLRPKAKADVPDGVGDVFEYEEEKERAALYRQMWQASRRGRPTPDEFAAVQMARPRDSWRLMQVMNMMGAHLTTNAVHTTIATGLPATIRSDIAAGLRAFVRQAPSGLKWKASAVQLFNPLTAKGYARLKPDSTDRNDKTKEQWTDPFVEWLRYRGYFEAAVVPAAGDDVRVYVPVPRHLTLAAFRRIVSAMRSAGLRGVGPKLDALAVLWTALYLVEHSREHAENDDELLFGAFDGGTPADVVSGLATCTFQKMGSARVVSSLTTLALPGWFPIASREDALAWASILDEHARILRGLEDDHSDEIGLALAYRRFLEVRGEHAVWAFVDFAGDYGQFLLRARDAGRRVRGFWTSNFRRLIEGMESSFAAVLDDPGFQAVARAVRRATVEAQGHKARGAARVREIRYDLLPELRRARMVGDGDHFVEVVSDFVARYNVENARRREMGLPAPANVHTDQLSRFMRLLDDKRQVKVVGALLCAYGTCTESREAGPTDGAQPASVDEPGDDTPDEEKE